MYVMFMTITSINRLTNIIIVIIIKHDYILAVNTCFNMCGETQRTELSNALLFHI